MPDENNRLAKTSPIAVVGGGVAGMIQALLLARAGAQVTLIERAAELGGLFTSTQTPFGPLDRGIHLFYETGVDPIDRLLREQLPEEDWIRLQGVRKDVAGNYFRGKLNTGSIFADIRLLGPESHRAGQQDLLARAAHPVPGFADSRSLADFFELRFGAFLAREVLAPIARKIWKHDPALLSPWAARIVHMTRLIVDDPQASLRLKMDSSLDQLVGFPDQLRLPTHMLSSRLDAFYPRRFGLTHFIAAFERSLKAANVRIAKEVRVDALIPADRGRIRLDLHGRESPDSRIAYARVVWTSPIEPLANLLGVSIPHPPDKPNQSVTVFLFLSEAPRMADLYYFYCFDPGFATFRISNFSAFCPSATTTHGVPMSVELHFPPGELPDGASIEDLAIDEALRFGVVPTRSSIRAAHRLPPGAFFVPTIANVAAIGEAHSLVDARRPDGVILNSQNLATGSFYLHDALRAAYSNLQSLL